MMNKYLMLLFLLISSHCFSQGGGTSCPVCPPSLKGVTTGWVLTDSAGKARWKMLPINDTIDEWSLTGNAGTNPSINFLGTTDDVNFIIKRNNNAVLSFTNHNDLDAFFINNSIGDRGFSLVSANLTPGAFTVGIGDVSGAYNNTSVISYVGSSSNVLTGDSTVIAGRLKVVDGTQGPGKVLTDSIGTGLANWENHIGTQANHLKYAYIDTVHTLASSLYIGNAHLSQTSTGTGFTADSLKMTWKGDLSGTTTAEPTVAKLNGQLPSYYLSRANATGTQLASTISDFATATNTQLSALTTYTTPALAQTGLGSGKPYILSTTIGIVNVLLLSITP